MDMLKQTACKSHNTPIKQVVHEKWKGKLFIKKLPFFFTISQYATNTSLTGRTEWLDLNGLEGTENSII